MESLLRTISDSAGLDLGSLLDTVDGDEKTLALEKAVELLEERRRAEGQLKAEGERAASAILPDSFQSCLLEGSHTMEKVGPSSAYNILSGRLTFHSRIDSSARAARRPSPRTYLPRSPRCRQAAARLWSRTTPPRWST